MNSFKESDLPILVVDGDPADWLPCAGHAHPNGPCAPMRNTVRIDGPLPRVKVLEWKDGKLYNQWDRPLQKDDRVTLATPCPRCHGRGTVWITSSSKRRPRLNDPDPGVDATAQFDCPPTVPFATATVANITEHYEGVSRPFHHWHVTVTDVEALG
jgi:hypothetical protein